ncbi:MAG: HAMP domain-containing protein [Nitrospiraceae bacterium]|nr:HAMP domain-containing protein [Nitrospiraceae bacterium]
MSFMRRLSFQTKLFASLILVILLTTILGYTLIHLAVDQAFHRFVTARARIQKEDLFRFAARYLEQANNEQELLRILKHGPLSPIVTDKSGKIVAAPDPTLIGRVIAEKELSTGVKVTLRNGTSWFLLPFRPPHQVRSPLERGFLRTVTGSLWLAGLTVAIVGIGLGFFLLRQLTGPINRLAVAAHSVANGEFEQRVPVETTDELGRLAAAFNDMALSLERAERAKRRMITDVSHELRTPLNVVRNGLEGLRDGIIAPTPENLSALHSKVLLTVRLVDDLHQLALADADQLMIHPTVVDLREVIAGIEKTIGPELEDRGIDFHIEVADGVPPVRGDADRIEQVLLNLLANAARYTEAGGAIRVKVRQTGETVETSVCNSGHELSAAELEHVFDRFYRADPSRTQAREGSGLGLAIAKALVEAHGGRIWAENAPHNGPCFRFTLPRG